MLVSQESKQDFVYYFPVHVMPSRVTLVEVTGLVEAVESAGNAIELSDLARLFPRQSSPHLLSILKASQELGLIWREGGLVSITDLGLGFVRATDGKVRIIRAVLARIEPFKTTLELLSKKKTVSSHEVSEALIRKKNIILSPSQISEDFVRTTLIEWGISSCLLSYNGKFSLS